MRALPLLPLAFALAASPAFGQVSVNNQALDSLSHAGSGAAPAHRPPAHHVAPRKPAAPHRAAKAPTHPATPPARAEPAHPSPALPAGPPPPAHATPSKVTPKPNIQAAPAIPAAPPPDATLAPATPAGPAHPVPPPPVPVVSTAQGETATISGGVRITFGPGSADLNAATLAAVQKFARLVKDQPIGIDLVATAAGSADDPSTPRRVSLSRALAVRAVLINEGIASTRIYPRAMGPNIGDGPPERVDIIEHKVTPAPDTEPKP